MEFHKMTENNETQLNEAELSAVKNSIASLAKKYITGSFFDKLADSVGLSQAKTILANELENMIGHGTGGTSAKRFSQAIQYAKNKTAVDTILANYMLAGDGMKSGIGYTESQDAPAGEPVSEASVYTEITGFRQFLSESRKNDLKEKQKKSCDGKKSYKTKDGKEIPKEKIDEAIAIVKAAGCTVDDSKIMPSEEEIAEAIKVAEANGFRVLNEKKGKEDAEKCGDEDDKKKVEEALALIKAAGMTVNESSGDDWVTVPTLGVDPDDLRDAIDDGIALKYIKDSDSIKNIYVLDGAIMVKFDNEAVGAKEILSEIRDGLKQLFMEDAGSVVAYGEDTVDELDHIFDAAIKQA
jgi:hypothetical protein